jgi:succinate dehydrogenase / fumarate reductase, flavoprotein subunit
MTSFTCIDEIIETDVLIVGGGLSGLWSANRARDFVKNVLIVDKGPAMGYAGEGYFSGGNIQALPPGDKVDDYVGDVISLGDGLYEQDLVEKILDQSWDRIQDFRKMGVEFEEHDGKLRYIPQRGLKHNACFIGKPSGNGGKNMMIALAREANRLGVKYLARTQITSLIKQDDTVVGAVGFNIRTGKFYIFKAKAVIMATGGCSFRGGYEDTQMAQGEGTMIAFDAGAELRNLEFITMWVIPVQFRWEGVTFLLPLGAKFTNRLGEEFMKKYSPVLKSNVDYNFIARAMAMEAREGRSPFYLDCDDMKKSDKELMTPAEGWPKLQYDQLLNAGIRPFDERQEWTATPWNSDHVHSDHEMKTSVPGLFVAGTVRNVDPGIYFGGWSICKTAAFGRWAGESAGKYAEFLQGKTRISKEYIKTLKQDTFSGLGKEGIAPEEILRELQGIIFPTFVLKNEAKLKEARQKLEGLMQDLLPRMAASDLHQLSKLKGVRSMTRIGDLVLKASQLRKESRASHYREDFPERNNKEWLKWIIAYQKGGIADFRFEPVPLAKYKHKTWDHYSDYFNFPKYTGANK